MRFYKAKSSTRLQHRVRPQRFMTLAESPIEHHYAQVNGVRLHYVESGEGPLVLLLHGFPDFWGGWRKQIKALSQAGFRVVAPDLRGYNLSSKPRGICNYSITHLVEDVVALIHHLGEEKAAVAGHDWGGIIAWHLAMRQPRYLSKLIILNAPHPATFARELRTWRQMRKSSYALFFQLPFLPERTIRARDFTLVKGVFRLDPINRRAFSRRDIDQEIEALSQPRALTSALNYYRALRCHPRRAFQAKRIETPTLLIWGEQDRYLGVQLTQGLERWVPHLQLERLPDASHWVHRDQPQRVNQLMIDFLRDA